MRDRHEPPLSCDTLIALDAGAMVFGKNSDRPLDEAQPLESVPARRHTRGRYVRCQYLTIPQATETLAVLGSRPWWMWGFEHGLNEAGVVIGNEAISTSDEIPDYGLTGMDLVRLGLERGRTAAEALDTITALIAAHGQGGAGRYLSPPGYFNSFIVADGREAYVLETSGRHWVAKRLTHSHAIANLITIADDWDACSDGIDAHARDANRWWGPPGRKLNFRAAFENRAARARVEPRYEAGCRYLTGPDACSVPAMMRHLRDHFETGTIHAARVPGDPCVPSVCAHPAERSGATAASMVVRLSPDQALPPVAWCSMSPPCTGVFLPVRVGAELPARLTIGGDADDPASLWWTFYRLARLVELDPPAFTPEVQDVWGMYETKFVDAVTADPESSLPELADLAEEVHARAHQLIERIEARLR